MLGRTRRRRRYAVIPDDVQEELAEDMREVQALRKDIEELEGKPRSSRPSANAVAASSRAKMRNETSSRGQPNATLSRRSPCCLNRLNPPFPNAPPLPVEIVGSESLISCRDRNSMQAFIDSKG